MPNILFVLSRIMSYIFSSIDWIKNSESLSLLSRLDNAIKTENENRPNDKITEIRDKSFNSFDEFSKSGRMPDDLKLRD